MNKEVFIAIAGQPLKSRKRNSASAMLLFVPAFWENAACLNILTRLFELGALFVPDTDSLPVPDVTVNTRRGVYVTYEPAQNEQ